MLLRYNVSNFKSIGHSVEFSMLPFDTNTDERFLRTIKTKAGDWKVLCRAGFFGPNASGKSAFMESIKFAKNFITTLRDPEKELGTGIVQFKGNFKDIDHISSFQFIFYLDGEVYDYGFTVDRKWVHEEWLMILTEKGFMPLFTRSANSDGKVKIDIESRFARKNSETRKMAEILKQPLQENQTNQLLLYRLSYIGNRKAEKIVRWFNKLQIIFPYSEYEALPVLMKFDDNFQKFMSEKLKGLDTGVMNIAVDRVDFDVMSKSYKLPQDLIARIEGMGNGFFYFGGDYFIFSEENKKIVMDQIKFEHKLNDSTEKLSFSDESDGTKRLLDLLPILFEIENGVSQIYFVDEIDRSLHTKLSRYLLDEFIHKNEATFSQLVFTSHDVNLLNLNDFAQDEIWFVEKNILGESELRPLSDFDIKNGQNPLKAYLNGRFGAIPVIRRNI